MSGYEYGKGDMGGRYDRGLAQEYRGGDMGGREGMMEKIPGTEAHRAHQGRSDNMGKTASDPVYGETKPHHTDMGAKAESTWHKAKANMPGTKEHRMMKEGNEGEGRYDNVRDEADRAAMGYERRHGQETAGGDWGQDRARGTAGVGAAGGYNTMGDRGYEGAAGGAGGFGTSEAGYHKHGTTGASAGYGSQPTGYSTERRTHDEHEDKGIMGQMMDKVKSVMPGAKTDEEKRVQEHSGRGGGF